MATFCSSLSSSFMISPNFLQDSTKPFKTHNPNLSFQPLKLKYTHRRINAVAEDTSVATADPSSAAARRLYVGNIPRTATNDEHQKIVEEHGSVEKMEPTKKSSLHSSFETLTEEEEEDDVENARNNNRRRKIFVLNLPWSFSVADIKKLFSECGTVADVEIIKQKNGKNRGFAFVTMASGVEAQAAIEKYDSYELVGRIIRVQFAKRFKKPACIAPEVPPLGETRHKLYVSNLAWKVRSNNLREFFSSNFNPVSVRVVFENPSGRSAGYGFVCFATKEEADLALSELDGKELLGRPIRLKFSEKMSNPSESKEEPSDQQPEESQTGSARERTNC